MLECILKAGRYGRIVEGKVGMFVFDIEGGVILILIVEISFIILGILI